MSPKNLHVAGGTAIAPDIRKALAIAGCVLGLLAVFVGTTILAFRYEDQKRLEVLTGEIPSSLPIIVSSGPTVEIVWGDQFDDFKQKHPDYSLLVPPGKESWYKEEIRNNTRAAGRIGKDLPWDAHFEVETIGEGRQMFKVDATWDEDRVNYCEYEATEKEIFSRAYKFYFGPGVAMKIFPVPAITTLLAALLVGYLLHRKRFL